MSKIYDEAPQEVRDRLMALIQKYHPDLLLVQLRVDLLMASTDVEDAHAVTLGGYPCLAVVKIVGPKERAKGCGDAEIVIDRDAYNAMDGAKRDALLDHELYHLEIVRGKTGQPKMDDHQRPKLKMRKHDFQFGWFAEIARRHQENSFEVQQARTFAKEQAQTFFAFSGELMASMLPTEDSYFSQPANSRATQPVAECPGEMAAKIVAEGIHTQPTETELDEATKLAFGEGHVTRSMLQRRLQVGYTHACAIVERLVKAGLVAAEDGVGRFLKIAQSNESPPASAEAA